MDEDEILYRKRREKMLVVSFGFIGLFGLLVTFTVLTGGFLLYILLVGGVMAAFGAFHYLLWGRMLSENTAGEREELEARERAEAESWEQDDPRRPRHF